MHYFLLAFLFFSTSIKKQILQYKKIRNSKWCQASILDFLLLASPLDILTFIKKFIFIVIGHKSKKKEKNSTYAYKIEVNLLLERQIRDL